MKSHIPRSFRAVAASAVIFLLSVSMQADCQQKQYTSSGMGNVGNGYHYELWTNGKGSITMTVYGQDAKFKAVWSSVGDFVARVGLKYNETKTHTQIGTFSSDYVFTKTNVVDLMYAGIYGWTSDPLIEYYILEDWNAWHPTGNGDGHTIKGTITVDGAEYQVLTKEQIGQPSIKGNSSNFTQYWSIRKQTRQSGHISISEHFNQWEKMGLKLGKMYEVKLKVEGMNGQGTVDFTKAILTDGSTPAIVPFVSKTPSGHTDIFKNISKGGDLSYVSLNGTVLKTVHLDGPVSELPSTSGMASGTYFMKFQGDGFNPVTRTLQISK